MQGKKPLALLVGELEEWRRSTGRSHAQIAAEAGVSPSSVYRIFNGDTARAKYGPALRAICEIASISIGGTPATEPVPSAVRDAVFECWDGTEEHAVRLAKAIKALGELLR